MSVAVVFSIGFGTWFVINPSLYPSPVEKSYRYYLMRESIMAYQVNEESNKIHILSTPGAKIAAVACAAFSPSWISECSFHRSAFVIYSALFVVGVWYTVRKTFENFDRYAMFAVVTLILSIQCVLYYSPFAWDRYYLSVNLMSFIVFSCGIQWAYDHLYVRKRI